MSLYDNLRPDGPAIPLLNNQVSPVTSSSFMARSCRVIKIGSNIVLKPFIFLANLIKSIVMEVLALLVVILTLPFKGTWFDPKSENAQGKPPVLLVHGYLHNSSAWHVFRKSLESKGFVTYTVDLGQPIGSSIDETYVKRVHAKVEQIKRETGRKDIRLVGHSMGGVVSSQYSAFLPPESDTVVTHVVTLGSPIEGTKLAKIGLGKCATQMRHHSPESQLLVEKIKTVADRIHFLFIGSSVDPIIRPTGSATPEIENTSRKQYDDLGHMTFLYSPKVMHDVAEFLNRNSNPL